MKSKLGQSNMEIQCPSCDQRLEVPEELFGQTIDCPACNASLAAPSDDPNVPDVRKPWCRVCKGHHGTKTRHGSRWDYSHSVCFSCGSSDVRTPSPITIWTRLGQFSFIPIAMLLTLIGQIYLANSFEAKVSKIDYWALSIKNPFYWFQAIFLVLGYLLYKLGYKPKVITRNDWLNWAKDRGYDEHSENK